MSPVDPQYESNGHCLLVSFTVLDSYHYSMNWRSILTALLVTLVTLAIWWASILFLDGVLGMMLPYEQY